MAWRLSAPQPPSSPSITSSSSGGAPGSITADARPGKDLTELRASGQARASNTLGGAWYPALTTRGSEKWLRKIKAFDSECPICLSLFEEGEEVRKLPRCKHSFHASCIDMWLYSHYDCPVCRATVEPPIPRWLTAADSQVIAQVEPLGRGIPL
ncbi:hypothetical protein NMG60_11013552 [Bertholletia excelsa]